MKSKKKPEISIIMNCYNGERYLKEAIDSIYQQDYQDWEIIFWDNVSGIDKSDTTITSITNDNYTHSNMDNGSTYYYKVAAVNDNGSGDLSNLASAVLSANIMGSETNSGHTYALTSSTMNWQAAADAAACRGCIAGSPTGFSCATFSLAPRTR